MSLMKSVFIVVSMIVSFVFVSSSDKINVKDFNLKRNVSMDVIHLHRRLQGGIDHNIRNNYISVNSDMKTLAANSYCEKTFSTHLSTITSLDDLACIRHVTVSGGISPNFFLIIGANDISNEGIFEWFDGTSMNYFENWNVNQPDNYNGNEDCVEMYQLFWNDMACDDRSEAFICNYPRYIGVNVEKSWTDANSYCLLNYGTTLATIGNFDEITFALSGAYAAGISTSIDNSPWFGLNDIYSEGTFSWIDGSITTFRNWASGEPWPNNSGGNQNCGKLYPSGTFDVDFCSYSKAFLCNFPKYIGVSYSTNWNNANAYCVNNFGTTLATVTSFADNNDVRNAGTKAGVSTNNRLWIGLTDFGIEGTWIWIENSLDANGIYNNWGSGQPNNLGNNQHCATMVSSNEWDDRECDTDSHAFVCNAPQYIAVKHEMSWSKANSYCMSTFGTTLATIKNLEMNNIVRYSATAIGVSYTKSLWIGLSDQSNEGSFSWQDGSSLTYTNWQSGEPNNSGDEDCVELYQSGKWNDKECSANRYFVCNL